MKPIVDTIIPLPQDYWPFKHTSLPNSAVWDFYGSDSKSLFEKNQNEIPSNWMYHDTPVIYNFNEQGLRMKKNVQDVKGDYIYFGGSSFTLGCGLNEEDRFTEKVSASLGLDFINFSGPIYGVKLQAMSFFNFLQTSMHLPKVLVIEHFPDAYNFYSNGNYLLYKSKFKANKEQWPHHYAAFEELEKTDFYVQESTMYINFLKSTCHRLNIKLVEMSFYNEDRVVLANNIPSVNRESHIEDLNYCFSRDVYLKDDGTYTGHGGKGVNQEMTDLLLTLI
jgi:hypothetical protein